MKTGKNWWFVLLYPPSFCESFFNFFTLFQVGLNQLYKVLKNVENISTILANFQKEKKKKEHWKLKWNCLYSTVFKCGGNPPLVKYIRWTKLHRIKLNSIQLNSKNRCVPHLPSHLLATPFLPHPPQPPPPFLRLNFQNYRM